MSKRHYDILCRENVSELKWCYHSNEILSDISEEKFKEAAEAYEC